MIPFEGSMEESKEEDGGAEILEELAMEGETPTDF